MSPAAVTFNIVIAAETAEIAGAAAMLLNSERKVWRSSDPGGICEMLPENSV